MKKLPSFWPKNTKGLVLLEEPKRNKKFQSALSQIVQSIYDRPCLVYYEVENNALRIEHPFSKKNKRKIMGEKVRYIGEL